MHPFSPSNLKINKLPNISCGLTQSHSLKGVCLLYRQFQWHTNPVNDNQKYWLPMFFPLLPLILRRGSWDPITNMLANDRSSRESHSSSRQATSTPFRQETARNISENMDSSRFLKCCHHTEESSCMISKPLSVWSQHHAYSYNLWSWYFFNYDFSWHSQKASHPGLHLYIWMGSRAAHFTVGSQPVIHRHKDNWNLTHNSK